MEHFRAEYFTMKSMRHGRIVLLFGCIFAAVKIAHADITIIPQKGLASWYGEQNRGKLMANGRKFNPDKLTAASWFYPLGTRVRVTVNSPDFETRSVLVTITDPGPA